MSTRGTYLIGGSKAFGSGKVVTFLCKGLRARNNLLGFIETQGARGGIVKAVWSLPRGANVLFQPSICFPAFLRDVMIVILLRLKGVNISYLLLVDVTFKNRLLRFSFFRRLFFGRSAVLGLAAFSQHIANASRVPPFFDVGAINRLPLTDLARPIAVLHLGYRIDIKGWGDLQARVRAEPRPPRVIAIGGKISEAEVTEAEPIELMSGASTGEIETALKSIVSDCLPVYLFLSREDFAPLMVLEAGFWGVPIATIRKSRAHGILSRMLPQDCFVVVESLNGIVQSRSKLLHARQSMHRYLESVTPDKFLDAVSQHLQLEPDQI